MRNNKVMNFFKPVKVLVWDLDGTLYKEAPEIRKTIYKNVIDLIAKAKLIPVDKAEKLFQKAYKRLGSSTRTMLYYGVNKKDVIFGDWHSGPQLKYMKKDKRLIKMFKKLGKLKHVMNTNGNCLATKKKMIRLGLKVSTFEKIFTNADMFGVLKPDLLPFREVLKYTRLKPEEHLFIGDRDETDLVPAKKVGMKTCMVWKKSKIADMSLPRVYDVVKLF